MDSWTIRERCLGDWPALIRMLRNGFPAWYRRLPYLLFKTFVAEQEGWVLGFVSVPMRRGVGEIGLIAVDERARGQGVGSLLLKSALDWMGSCGLQRCVAKVRPDNTAAHRLFTTVGFERVGIRQRKLLGDVYIVERIISPAAQCSDE